MDKIMKIELEKYLVSFAIFTSILSFSPNTSISGICGRLMYLFWGVTLILKFFQSRMQLNQTVKYMFFTYALFFVLCYFFYFMDFYPSPGSGGAGNLGFCAIFYLIGYNYSWKEDISINLILFMCIFAYLIITYTSFTMSNETQNSVIWNKNQLGQMLGSALIFEVLIIPRKIKNTLIKIFLYFSGLISLIALMNIRSRTPIIALLIVFVTMFISKKNKTRKDYGIAFLVIIAISLLILYMGGTDFLIELFDLESDSEMNTSESLNNMTSGRLDWYKLALQDFLSSPIIGIGAYAYIDSFFICTLRTGGILMAIFVLPFVYGKLFKEFKKSGEIINAKEDFDNNVIDVMYIVRCFTIYFFVISLMEGYPPLGPGTSVFLLWIFYGISDNIIKNLYGNVEKDKNIC